MTSDNAWKEAARDIEGIDSEHSLLLALDDRLQNSAAYKKQKRNLLDSLRPDSNAAKVTFGAIGTMIIVSTNKINSLHPIIELLEQLRRSLDLLPMVSDVTREFTPIFKDIVVQIVTQLVVIMWLSNSASRIGFSTVTKSDTVKAGMSKLECLISDAVWAFDPSLEPFNQAWADAVAKYKTDTGVDTSSSSEFPDVDSVEGLCVAFNVNRDGPNPRKIEEVLKRRVLCHGFQEDIRQLFEELRGAVELMPDISKFLFGTMGAMIIVAMKHSASYDVIVKMFDRLHILIQRLKLGTQHHAVVESKKHLARILVQIQIVLSFSTKLLKDHSFRLQLASIGRLDQSVFAGNKPLQSAITLSEADCHFERVWGDAVKKYQAACDIDITSSIDVNSRADLQAALDNGIYKFGLSRQQHGEIRDLLKPIFHFVDLFLGVTSDAASLKFKASKTTFSAITVLFNAAKMIGTQNDLVTNIFKTLQGFLNRLEVLGEPQGKVSPKLESILVETLCQLLVILGLATKVVKKGRLYEIQQEIGKLDGLILQEQHMLAAEEFRLLGNISKQINILVGSGQHRDTHCLVDIPQHKLPAKPSRLIGRDNVKSEVIKSIVDGKPVIILGSGGIGKTTLALAVLHDDQVAKVISTEAQDQYLKERILQMLHDHSTPAILCIDNLETLWEIPSLRSSVESLLAALTRIPNTAIIVTMRGTEKPGQCEWTPLHSLHPLSTDQAMQIFKEVTGERTLDKYGMKLLDATGGLPLAISLLGHLAQTEGETTEDLWHRPRIQAEPVAPQILALLVILPDGFSATSDRLDQLELHLPPEVHLRNALHVLNKTALIYINETVAGRRYQLIPPIHQFVQSPHANIKLPLELQLGLITLILLAALSGSTINQDVYPAAIYYSWWRNYLGSATEDIILLAEEKSANSLDPYNGLCLRVLGEVFMEKYKWGEAETSLLQAVDLHKQAQNNLGPSFFSRDDGAEDRQLSLVASIQLSLSSPRVQAEPVALQIFALLAILPDGFSAASDRLDQLELHLPPEVHLRNALHVLNKTALIYINETVAGSTIDRDVYPAAIYYSCWRNYLGSATEDIILLAEEKSANSLDPYNGWCLRVLGEAQDVLSEGSDRLALGQLYMHTDRLEKAETSLLQAVDLHKQAQDVLSEGSDQLRLGELYMRTDRLEEAETSLLQAVDLHKQAQHVLSEGSDRLALGQLYMRTDRLEKAETSLLQAVDLHKQAQDVLSEGSDRLMLGKLYMHTDRLEEAETSLLQAVDLHKQAQNVLGEGSDQVRLGKLYMRTDRLEEAETSLLQAVDLHKQAQDVLSEGSD
ncbi:hypothetical protein PILCRDRAFT_791896 [Piloderma croceum F 1598]|uniref:Fungal STAND N-terminal Goodbye domain-containing protein n=1 Tax=Piloderma croceum (strain F 1598) TaxID=765440 RepID=A0A0C3FI80_PILCF|nr:hypothetical protein PILCRDRAFT_791896 [Piloderma croceum F 1598]